MPWRVATYCVGSLRVRLLRERERAGCFSSDADLLARGDLWLSCPRAPSSLVVRGLETAVARRESGFVDGVPTLFAGGATAGIRPAVCSP